MDFDGRYGYHKTHYHEDTPPRALSPANAYHQNPAFSNAPHAADHGMLEDEVGSAAQGGVVATVR